MFEVREGAWNRGARNIVKHLLLYRDGVKRQLTREYGDSDPL